MKNKWIPIGEAIQVLTSPQHIITNYKQRATWSLENLGCLILAFYNTGHNLFIDPKNQRANSYYDYSWAWMKYCDFSNGGYGGLLMADINSRSLFRMIHLGHNQQDQSVRINLSGVVMSIPKCCIQYVAIKKNGYIEDTLLVHQPLPMKLFKTFC